MLDIMNDCLGFFSTQCVGDEMNGATPDATLPLCSESHKGSILRKCDDLRVRGLLCDITLIVEDVHFKAHKVILAASSDYFSSMFNTQEPTGQSSYPLGGMGAKAFSRVLEFIYGAQVSVEQSSAEQLLAAARLLGVTGLVQALSGLSRAQAGPQDGEVGADDPEVLTRPKRKRGRPRRVVSLPATAVPRHASQQRESSKERTVTRHIAGDGPGVMDDLAGSTEDDNPLESRRKDSDDADYQPEAERSRHSKRKVRPPIKYVGYRVGSIPPGTREPGRPGRKKKYPETEARCEDCGKMFKNHMFLKIHLRTHTGEIS